MPHPTSTPNRRLIQRAVKLGSRKCERELLIDSFVKSGNLRFAHASAKADAYKLKRHLSVLTHLFDEGKAAGFHLFTSSEREHDRHNPAGERLGSCSSGTEVEGRP